MDSTLTFSNIPGELKALPQWVCWDPQDLRGAKPSKVPITPGEASPASVADPATWGTFEEAWADATASGRDIGFFFTEDDPYVGVDLDACRDPDSGAIEPWAEGVIDTLDSYTEVSPSGTGIHIFVRGKLTTLVADHTLPHVRLGTRIVIPHDALTALPKLPTRDGNP